MRKRRKPRRVSPEDQEVVDELQKRLAAGDVERSAVTRESGGNRELQEAIDRLPPGDPQRDMSRARWVPCNALQNAPSGAPQIAPRRELVAFAGELVAKKACRNFEEAVRFSVVCHLNRGIAESEALARAREHRLTQGERKVVDSTLRFAQRQRKKRETNPAK